MLRIEAQDAYILHTYPYRETSLILKLFTPEYGLLAVIARGAKRRKSQGILQPFVPLLISCAGSRDLLSLKTVETVKSAHLLQGRRLISAFYLNELLIRLLHPRDPCPTLFQLYRDTLIALERGSEEQKILRLFEKSLLKTLGYELQLTVEVESGLPIDPHCFYFFDPERGPSLVRQDQGQVLKNEKLFKGSSLLALKADTLSEVGILQDAKRLMRMALARHLGVRPLETRKLLSP